MVSHSLGPLYRSSLFSQLQLIILSSSSSDGDTSTENMQQQKLKPAFFIFFLGAEGDQKQVLFGKIKCP